MSKVAGPRKGSMQFYPRKRAKKTIARVRAWASLPEAMPLCFPGYKAGMTHIVFNDIRKTSLTKGMEVRWPVTIIECPPIKTASIRFYKHSKIIAEVLAQSLDKNLKITKPKNIKKKIEDIKDFDDVRLLVHTQPKFTGLGKKKPELFEIGLGGKKEEKLNYAKNILGKEIQLKDVFKEGEFVDSHAITKGHGVKGPVKRFGISLKAHKSEKSRRSPGSLGGWKAQGQVMYRVAHAGQTGFHQRTDYKKLILRVGDKPEDINQKGGFVNYGAIKNPYIIVKGSVSGPKKRLIKLTHSLRSKKAQEPINIAYISRESKQ